MNVTEAVQSRRSVRAFLDTPVPSTLLREAIELAARAPSGGNLQPWQIFAIAGEPLQTLKDRVAERLQRADPSERPEYEIYPSNLWEPHRTQRYALGEAMYATLGVGREDKIGRLQQFARNFAFFGAPAAVFCYIDRRMGPPQWSDLGMYLQTLMLLLRERGLDSCPQECWSVYPRTVASVLQPPEESMLFCGMSIGYADPDAPINTLQSERLPLDQFAQFLGFD
ncbi:nitroreductase [Sinimarinibacterium sp. CAU 1509]|uniref:nitroreductase n=1 Tax=Sinimarinibacterium sp. CAU 1509 TaxID=2562283 RepID=UPI0010ABEE85|nr:nitroreductase [Sinimarinibacterium sp. CAU 1509]TJY59513.1 nitroreductase [Sinimarinibacterium sp. CAU 1509]